jgi:hypothetical protein
MYANTVSGKFKKYIDKQKQYEQIAAAHYKGYKKSLYEHDSDCNTLQA